MKFPDGGKSLTFILLPQIDSIKRPLLLHRLPRRNLDVIRQSRVEKSWKKGAFFLLLEKRPFALLLHTESIPAVQLCPLAVVYSRSIVQQARFMKAVAQAWL